MRNACWDEVIALAISLPTNTARGHCVSFHNPKGHILSNKMTADLYVFELLVKDRVRCYLNGAGVVMVSEFVT